MWMQSSLMYQSASGKICHSSAHPGRFLYLHAASLQHQAALRASHHCHANAALLLASSILCDTQLQST